MVYLVDQFWKMNIIGFDSEISKKTGIRISEVASLELSNRKVVILRMLDAACFISSIFKEFMVVIGKSS